MKRSRPFFLAVTISILSLSACSDTAEIQMVKGGILEACDSATVEQMVDGFFGAPSWESGVSEDGVAFVNIEGEMTYSDKPVRALLQFSVDSDASSFQYNALEINELPQTNILAAALIAKMCESAVADSNH